MTPRPNKTGEYPMSLECIEAIVGFCESAYAMGFDDCNVWKAIASDGVPESPETPEEVYKVDSADLVIIIHYLLDHRRRLVGTLQDFRDSIEAQDLDVVAAKNLYLEFIDAALENRPGPFSVDE